MLLHVTGTRRDAQLPHRDGAVIELEVHVHLHELGVVDYRGAEALRKKLVCRGGLSGVVEPGRVEGKGRIIFSCGLVCLFKIRYSLLRPARLYERKAQLDLYLLFAGRVLERFCKVFQSGGGLAELREEGRRKELEPRVAGARQQERVYGVV